jgi:hypothetical protein
MTKFDWVQWFFGCLFAGMGFAAAIDSIVSWKLTYSWKGAALSVLTAIVIASAICAMVWLFSLARGGDAT